MLDIFGPRLPWLFGVSTVLLLVDGLALKELAVAYVARGSTFGRQGT